jgi:hypothetical protein
MFEVWWWVELEAVSPVRGVEDVAELRVKKALPTGVFVAVKV